MENNINRDEKLPEWQQHKAPVDVAKYFRKPGQKVGRIYKTHGAVWDSGDAIQQTGLLHLILDELELLGKQAHKARNQQEGHDALEAHRIWLKHFHDDAVRYLVANEKQIRRISRFCDPKFWRCSLEAGSDIHTLIRSFHRHYRREPVWYGWDGVRLLVNQVRQLKTIRNISDLGNLKNIGRQKAARIQKKMEEMKQSQVAQQAKSAKPTKKKAT